MYHDIFFPLLFIKYLRKISHAIEINCFTTKRIITKYKVYL